MDPFSLSIIGVAAFLASMLGSIAGSGGLIMMPLLMILGFSPHAAIATYRFGSFLFHVSASTNFYTHHILHPKRILPLALFAVAGSVVGAMLVLGLPAYILEPIIGVLVLLMLLVLIARKQIERRLKGHDRDIPAWVNHIGAPLIFFIIGAYGGFFGGGTGTLTIITFMVLLRLNALKATASARFIILCGVIMPLFIFLFTGLIDYVVGLIIGLGSLFGAWVGSSLAMRMGDKRIEYVVGTVCIILALKLFLF
ncbi:MAG: sulfite exporter TauE/SafE family protein [archaeon]